MKEIISILFNLKNEANMQYIENYDVRKIQLISVLIFAAEIFVIYLAADGAEDKYFTEWLVIPVLIFIGAVIECVSAPIIISAVLWGIDKLFLKMNADIGKYFRIAVLMFCIEPVISQFFVMINTLIFRISFVSDIIQLVMWIYSVIFAVHYIKVMYKDSDVYKAEKNSQYERNA